MPDIISHALGTGSWLQFGKRKLQDEAYYSIKQQSLNYCLSRNPAYGSRCQ